MHGHVAQHCDRNGMIARLNIVVLLIELLISRAWPKCNPTALRSFRMIGGPCKRWKDNSGEGKGCVSRGKDEEMEGEEPGMEEGGREPRKERGSERAREGGREGGRWRKGQVHEERCRGDCSLGLHT